MKFVFLIISFLLLACEPKTKPKSDEAVLSSGVVYGSDSRREVLLTSSRELIVSRAVASLIPQSRLILNSETKSYDIRTKNLAQQFKLCPAVNFAKQLSLGLCTAFLINKKYVMTANHCLEGIPQFCEVMRVSFDWTQNKTSLPINSVFKCIKVIKDEELDVAILELDRPVIDRQPLRLAQNELKPSTIYHVLSHPGGLPQKISVAQLRHLVHPETTAYSLLESDTFSGDSGAPVLTLPTREVHGMILRGENDYVPNFERGCREINKCRSHECKGETVLNFKSQQFKDFLDFASRQK